MGQRIFLSPSNITEKEVIRLVQIENFTDPSMQKISIDKFEKDLALYNSVNYCVSLSSGTAALHLGLVALGIKKGDKVVVPTLTFAATAFAVKYVGAEPVFIDANSDNWTIDPNLLESYLKKCPQSERPKALIPVDLFGRTCDFESIIEICNQFEISILTDAAESFGSRYKGKSTAVFGEGSILSFNTNKILTTLGGGAFLTNNFKIAEKVRYLSNQARDKVDWYEHKNIGFNYRLSPILAVLGQSQLENIDSTIQKRRENHNEYLKYFEDFQQAYIIKDSIWEKSNNWITNIRFNKSKRSFEPSKIRNILEQNNIESRFVWKPLHQQPIFKHNESYLNGVSDKIFEQSLCLPSGTHLSKDQISYISNLIKKAYES